MLPLGVAVVVLGCVVGVCDGEVVEGDCVLGVAVPGVGVAVCGDGDAVCGVGEAVCGEGLAVDCAISVPTQKSNIVHKVILIFIRPPGAVNLGAPRKYEEVASLLDIGSKP
jgi:hypothetical protein